MSAAIGHTTKRRVVCSALRDAVGRLVLGPRHFDAVMHQQIAALGGTWKKADQGFIDQHGVFMTREEALHVALANDQIIRRVGGDDHQLFSENLY